jgi:FkbM family methyltransferase
MGRKERQLCLASPGTEGALEHTATSMGREQLARAAVARNLNCMPSFVQLAASALRRVPLAHHLARRAFHLVRSAPPTASDDIRRVLGKRSEVTFVQIGSNDGRQGDPIFDLAKAKHGWRGLLVEPVSFLFRRLRQNYGPDPRFQFANVAVTESLGPVPFYYVSERAAEELPDAPWWHDQLGSFNREHLEGALGGRLAPYIVEEAVEGVPLRELLDRYDITQLDLLHVDTEGYDYRVLRQIDFARWRPSVIVYEHNVLAAEEYTAARELLWHAGYELTERGSDTVAVLSPALVLRSA